MSGFTGLQTCLDCGGPFVYVGSPDTVQIMRLDPTPVDDGELYVVGALYDYPKALFRDERRPRYNRHHCPGEDT